MLFESTKPEIFMGFQSLLHLIPALMGMAYTYKQKEWIKKVFNNRCAASSVGMKHKCGKDTQVHHINPQAWMYEHENAKEEDVDTQYNGIPLCADAHVGARGTKDCIHADQEIAAQDFRSGNKFAYGQLQERRTTMAQSGVIYWNTKWDDNMRNLVRNKVDRWIRNHGEPFPKKNHRNGNGNGK
jgi:hypothetical protein